MSLKICGKGAGKRGFMLTYTISTDPSIGDFTSVTGALQSLPRDLTKPVTLQLLPGSYHEKITIDRGNLTLIGMGASAEETIITYHDFAFDRMEDGSKRGTFRSYSVFVDASDVTFQNLTIENASGDENEVGQAIALYVDGDRFKCIDCRLLGRQDTLFTGPLPPKEVEPGGFVGPKQFAPRIPTRQYYQNCYICGNVDFIFGSATAYFEGCQIESLGHGHENTVQGYVTAASTPEGQTYGYVFKNCDLISNECPEGTVYLGRPWRDYAKTVLLDCRLGEHIHPELFHDWGKPAARENSYLAVDEVSVSAIVAAPASFVKCITKQEASTYTKQAVLNGTDGWNP